VHNPLHSIRSPTFSAVNGAARGVEGRGWGGGKRGGRRTERVALSELRIIITVVVGGRVGRHEGGVMRPGDGPGGREGRERPGELTGGDGKGCIYRGPLYTPAPSPRTDRRWKSTAFGGTGQENCLTTFRTGSESPNRSPITPAGPSWTPHLRSGPARPSFVARLERRK